MKNRNIDAIALKKGNKDFGCTKGLKKCVLRVALKKLWGYFVDTKFTHIFLNPYFASTNLDGSYVTTFLKIDTVSSERCVLP